MHPVFEQKIVLKSTEQPFLVFFAPIHDAEDAQKIALRFWDTDTINYTEHFCALYLNSAKQPVCFAEIARGGIASVLVDMKILFAHALMAAATNIIIFHNHPSGNLQPSTQDIGLTRKIADAAKILDMNLLDHIILTPKASFYYSFAEEGKI